MNNLSLNPTPCSLHPCIPFPLISSRKRFAIQSVHGKANISLSFYSLSFRQKPSLMVEHFSWVLRHQKVEDSSQIASHYAHTEEKNSEIWNQNGVVIWRCFLCVVSGARALWLPEENERNNLSQIKTRGKKTERKKAWGGGGRRKQKAEKGNFSSFFKYSLSLAPSAKPHIMWGKLLLPKWNMGFCCFASSCGSNTQYHREGSGSSKKKRVRERE